MSCPIPVVLFAYARPVHLARVLECLRENGVPLILAFADGPKETGSDLAQVRVVRELLRAVDWTDLRLVERERNLGLGPSVLAGVTAVAAEHDRFIVWEDDLVAVPGTYDWMCAALNHYAGDDRVMSVSARTHERVTPTDAGPGGYFDRRADCWVWGAYARSWHGMAEESAVEKMEKCRPLGWQPDDYGADLPIMAREETLRKTWATRWLYHHFEHGGLCLRPPQSWVENVGFDATATNTATASRWRNSALPPRARLPERWPEVGENPACRELWCAAFPAETFRQKWTRRICARLPRRGRESLERRLGIPGYFGNYRDFDAARADSTAAETASAMDRASAEARAIRRAIPPVNAPLVKALRVAAGACAGRLHVLDWRGGLGNTYWENRPDLKEVGHLRWSVVEHSPLVELGKREFATGTLQFFDRVEDCEIIEPIRVVLISAVLGYARAPHAILRDLAGGSADWLILDRTGFHRAGGDRLTVEHQISERGPERRPCWFLDRSRLMDTLGSAWELIDEWPTLGANRAEFEFRGLLFRRASNRRCGLS